MSIDPIAHGFFSRQLDTTHAKLVSEAEYLAEAWTIYLKEVRANKNTSLAAEAVRLTERSLHLSRDLARYDGAREVFHTLEGS
jgi:hypothetical protein